MKKLRNILLILLIFIGVCYLAEWAMSQPIPTAFDPQAIHQPSGQTAGDIIYYNGTIWTRLAKGTAGQVLEMNAGATAPEWDEDDGGTYQQVVTVAKSGGDYTTIQGAIDSITDATTTKRYVVRVMSGVYTESVTCKDYVDIIGAGRTNTIISGTSGTVLTFPANKCTVSEVGIDVDYGALGANSTAITSAGADSVLKDCDITVTKSGGDFTMNGITITAGSFRMSDCYFTYTTTGATVGTGLTQSAIKQTGVVTNVIMNNNEITISTTDTNDNLTGIETTATVTGICLLANNVITVDAGAAAASATGIWAYGTCSGAIFNQNRLTINCNASAYGIWIDSTAGGATIDTRHNEIIVTSVGAALSAFVAAGDTWNSSLDKITAASGYTNNGTVTFSSSPVDGDFTTTGTITTGGFQGTIIGTAYGGTGASTLNDLITLSTHTTGNYLATLADAGSNTIVVYNSGSEGAAVTLEVGSYSITNIQASSTLISAQTDVTSTDSDYILIWDATDNALKKVDMAEVRGTGSGTSGSPTSWVNWTGTSTNGACVINDSYNVTSVTRTGEGDYTIAWTNVFNDKNYGWAGSAETAGAANYITGDGGYGAGLAQTATVTHVSIRTHAGAPADPGRAKVIAFDGSLVANTMELGTDTTGNYVKDVADGTGIDGTASGEGATYTPTFDATELEALTWGAGGAATVTHSFDVTGNTTSMTYGNGTIAASGTLNLSAGGSIGVNATLDINAGVLDNVVTLNLTEGGLSDASVVDADIKDDTLQEPALNSTNGPTDNYILSYNAAGTNFTWVAAGAGDMLKATYDSGDSGGVDSLTTVDSTYASDYVLLIDTAVGTSNPKTDGALTYNATSGTLAATNFSGGGANLTSVDAATGDSATAFFDAGTIEHEYGGLQADVSGWTGLFGITGADTSVEVDLLSELLTAMSDVTAFITDDDMPAAGADPDIDAAGEIGRDTDDHALRGYASELSQFVYAQATKTIQFTIVQPDDLDENDDIPLWTNETGFPFHIRTIKAWSNADNSTFTLVMASPTNFDAETTIESITVTTDGTGVYYETITFGNIDNTIIQNGDVLIYDPTTFDAAWNKVTLIGFLDGDVN